MPDICTAIHNPSGCGHYDLTVTVDGVPHTIHIHETELLEPLTKEEFDTFVRLSARRLRQRGVTPAEFRDRVTHGEEATKER